MGARIHNTKILLKVLNINTDRTEWRHLCYIDETLYNKYMREMDITSNDLNSIVSRWCYEDFNVEIPMSSTKDILMLKDVVKDFYRRAYPDIYSDSEIDRQAWLRVWVSKKMKEELKIYGEECI